MKATKGSVPETSEFDNSADPTDNSSSKENRKAQLFRRAFLNDVRGNSDLSRVARMTWTALCGEGDTKEWNCIWPGIKKLSEHYGGELSDRSIQRGLRELERKHWICYPFGKQGGRGTITLCHLHAAGVPCDGTEVDQFTYTKEFDRIRRYIPGQRSATPVRRKGDNLSEKGDSVAKKGDNLSEKGDRNDGAYKEGTPERTIERTLNETSTSSTRAREPDGAGDGAKHHPVNPAEIKFTSADEMGFECIEACLREGNARRALNPRDKNAILRNRTRVSSVETKLSPLLDSVARTRILNGVRAAGLTLPHLIYLFDWDQAADRYIVRNPKGLLIKYAEDLQAHVAGLKFPDCTVCFGLWPCTQCERGRAAEQNRMESETQKREEQYTAAAMAAQAEEYESEKRRAQAAEVRTAQAESARLREQNICAVCKGSGTTNFKNKPVPEQCFGCHGTGKWANMTIPKKSSRRSHRSSAGSQAQIRELQSL